MQPLFSSTSHLILSLLVGSHHCLCRDFCDFYYLHWLAQKFSGDHDIGTEGVVVWTNTTRPKSLLCTVHPSSRCFQRKCASASPTFPLLHPYFRHFIHFTTSRRLVLHPGRTIINPWLIKIGTDSSALLSR
jgi:hypothetical protein